MEVRIPTPITPSRGGAVEFMRAAVRPAVTAALVAAQIGLAFAWAVGATNAPDAFAAFAPFTMTAMVFWFNDRSKRGGA